MEEENKKYLPIGTVVLLKGAKRELMVTGYCIIPKGNVYDKNGKVDMKKNQIFDYGACLYPEGVITSEQLFAFNQEQIEKICFMGYKTDKQEALSKRIEEAVKKMQEQQNNDTEQTKEGQE